MDKEMGHPKRGLTRRQGLRRGETLVETIVAFSVLLLLLTLVTTVIQGAIRLNGRAAEQLAALAADCERVELARATDGSRQSGTLSFTYMEDSTPGKLPQGTSYDCAETITVFSASGKILHSFFLQQ